MKKIITILILSLPFYSWAQEEIKSTEVEDINVESVEVDAQETETSDPLDCGIDVDRSDSNEQCVSRCSMGVIESNDQLKDGEPDIMLLRNSSGYRMNGAFLQYVARR